MLASLCCLLLSAAPAVDAAAPGYPRPELLIEAADLARALPAGRFRVLDARAEADYRAGHVPGAVRVDADDWRRAFQDGKDRDGWARRVGALGIDLDTPVVIYDDKRGNDAARVWWVLRYWGVRDARLLNGGWKAWRGNGRPVEKGDNRPRAVEPKLAPQPRRLATKDQVKEALGGKRTQILDARSTAEYCGTSQTARKAGAIPGAVHLEWTDTLDRTTGKFKSAAELARLFKQADIDVNRPATTYCQSGGRAAVLAFVLELMGGGDVRNYYRSWAEWGNADDTPVERPTPKK
jgi:thiosulfate/3-mercaptopyruvate sulfurtransferase